MGNVSFRKAGEKKALSDLSGVIVTGGSSGIGRCFIKLILSLKPSIQVCNLSRRKPDLDDEKDRIWHVPCDLGNPDKVEHAAGKVREFVEQLPPGKLWLLNNSGFGAYGYFPEPGLAQNLELIDVNVRGAVHLTGLLLPELKRRGGAIGNVASTAAFQPTSFLATYGASKAFLLNWSLALGEELRPQGVRVTAICPGPTSTAFFERAGFKEPVVESWLGHEPEAVAAFTFRAMCRGAAVAVPGMVNKAMTFASSKLPKKLAAAVAMRVLRRYRLKE